MNEMLTFVLNMREMVSPGLSKLANHSKSVFGIIDKSIANTQNKFNLAGHSVSALNSRLEILTQKRDISIGTADIIKANREIQALEARIERMQNLGRSTGGGIGSGGAVSGGGLLLGGLGIGAAYAAASGAMDIGRQALAAGMNAEQQIIALKTFVGEQKARGIYADIQQSSVLTPFTTADILPAMQMLISSGQDIATAKKDTWNLMNALSATGNAGNSFIFSLMGQHMAQASANGVIDGLTLREFQRTAHLPILRLIANDLYPKLAPDAGIKKVKDLDHISYHVFTHALQRASDAGSIPGALEAQSQTIAGKWSTIRDWWNVGLAKAVLDPKMHDMLIRVEDKMIGWLAKLPDLLMKLVPSVERLGDKIIDLIDWVSRNTSEIKKSVERMMDLTKAYLLYKGGNIVFGGAKGFLSELFKNSGGGLIGSLLRGGEGGIAALAGGASGGLAGLSGMGIAGMASGVLEATIGIGIASTLAIVGGIAGLIALVYAAEKGYIKEATSYNKSNGGAVGMGGNEYEDIMQPVRRGNNIVAFANSLITESKRRAAMPAIKLEPWSYSDPLAGISGVIKKAKESSPDKSEGSEGAETSGITGGGGKRIYFNFKNVVGEIKVDVKNAADALGISEEKAEEVFMQLLYSARSAMS